MTVPDFLLNDDRAREELSELQRAVAYMDRQAGKVLDALEEVGLADSTVIVSPPTMASRCPGRSAP